MIDYFDYFRITTNALARLDAEYDHWSICLMERGYTDPRFYPVQFFKAMHLATTTYRESILDTWNAYRPEGPLKGEELPNEVVRLTRTEQS